MSALENIMNALEKLQLDAAALDVEKLTNDESTPAKELAQLFLLRPELSVSQYRQIARHINCPKTLLAACSVVKSEWLEDAESLARIQLECLSDKNKREWEGLQKKWNRTDTDSLLLDYMFTEVFEGIEVKIGSEVDELLWAALYQDDNAFFYKFMLNNCPEIFLQYFVDRGGKENNKFLLNHFDARFEAFLLNNSSYKVRQELAASLQCSAESMTKLSQDKYLSVRKALALNPNCTRAAAIKLLKGDDEKIHDALTKNAALSDLIKKAVNDKRKSSVASTKNAGKTVKATSNAGASIQKQLKLLSDPILDEETVFECASSQHDVLQAAAAHHAQASERVYKLVLQSQTTWVSAAAAQYTNDSEALRSLATSSDFEIQFAIACNPSLPEDARQTLLLTAKKPVVAQQLAAVFHDDDELLDAITEKTGNWGKRLQLARDPDSGKGALTSLHKSDEYRQLAISIALAKHPTTSDAVRPFLYEYLPSSLKPAKKPSKSGAYRKWKLNSQFEDGRAHACLVDHYLEPCRSQFIVDKSHLKLIRFAMACRELDISKVSLVVLWDDAHIAQRMMREDNPNIFTQYAYEALSYHRLGSVRKALATNKRTPKSVVQRLCHDKDVAVRDSAIKAAAKRKIKLIPSQPKSDKPKKLVKHERLHIAESSSDATILKELAADKTPDVRIRVTKNPRLDQSTLISMLDDDNKNVLYAALHAIVDKRGTDHSKELINRAINFIQSDDEKLARLALRLLYDFPLDKYYPSSHIFVNEHVAQSTKNDEVMQQIVFDTLRSQNHRLARSIIGNTSLPLSLCEQLADFIQVEKNLYMIGNNDFVFNIIKTRGAFTEECGYRSFKAIFTPEQVRSILEIDKKLVSRVENSLHGLEEQELSDLYNSNKSTAAIVASIPNLPKPLVELMKTSRNRTVLDMLLSTYQFTEHEISKHLEDNSYKSLWSTIAAFQHELSDKQLEKISRKQSCHWELLARDGVPNYILEYIFENCESDLKAVVAEKLGISVHSNHKFENQDIAQDTEKDEVLTLSESLALHKAPFAAAKAYKLLEELGIVTLKNDESVRKVTHAGMPYAKSIDETPMFLQSKFEELLQKMIDLHSQSKAA